MMPRTNRESSPDLGGTESLLRVERLEVGFVSERGFARAVRGVSLEVRRGETVGLAGESGCGKTTTALSIMRLIPPSARVTGGRVLLDGVDLLCLRERELRRIRGRRIGMVFQDAMTALNPLLTIGRQISEVLESHLNYRHRRAMRRAAELLEEVGVSEPDRRLRQYPHQLSGGLRQRVGVAIAIAPNPDVLIADEPTTSLDVTIQAQLLELLRREQAERHMGLILITHDLGVLARLSDRLAVMYAGHIVEEGPTDVLFREPRHPYTLGLIEAVPRVDRPASDVLMSIGGTPPQIDDSPTGCPFVPRCIYRLQQCETQNPALADASADHSVACWADIRRVDDAPKDPKPEGSTSKGRS